MNKQIGARLRQMRKDAGLRLGDLADLVECSYQQICKYETGQNRIALPVAIKLCQALNRKLDDLVPVPPPGDDKVVMRVTPAQAVLFAAVVAAVEEMRG